MREAQTPEAVKRNAETRQAISETGPTVLLHNITFSGGVIIEYPEGHNLIITNCDFENENETVTLKVLPRTATDAEMAEAQAKLQEMMKDLE